MKNITLGIMLILLLLSGCGYHLPGRGNSLPDDVQKVVINPFENKTTQPFIETQLTNEVRDQFARRRTLDVVASVDQADVLLSGTIVGYRSNAIAYDTNDDITEYRLTMTVEANLARVNGEEVLWQGAVSWSDEFFASNDRAQQDYHESQVQDKVTRRLAQEIYNRITDNF
ncbi:MAG: LptE family protein [Thermodesulfobacteriota bacterium]|nr:LptE family protein [Thermodesulfobacteriota bacterium]